MDIGRNAIYFEDYVLSIQYFNRVIYAKPYLAEPYFYRAVAKISLEDYVGAETDCSYALERNPFMIDAYRCRGAARSCMGRYESALEDFNKGLEQEPKNKELLLMKGSVYACAENWDSAISVFSDLLKFYPRSQEAYLRRGYTYFSSGDTINAKNDFEKALFLDRFSADAHAARGFLLGAMKDYERGVMELNEAIRLEPYCVNFYINRGAVYANSGDNKSALADYDYALQLDPSCSVAYFNRAILHTKSKNYKLALADYDRVVELDPNNYFAIFNRALVNQELSRYNAAINDVNRLLEEYPDYYPAYFMRSELKSNLKNKRGAEEDYNMAMVIQQRLNKEADRKGKVVDEETKLKKKKKRDMDKHGELVVMDKREEMRRLSYKTEMRGRVQNVNFHIELSPMLLLSSHPKRDVALGKTSFFDKRVESLNTHFSAAKLELAFEEEQIGTEQLKQRFHHIDSLSLLISTHPTDLVYFERAMDYESVTDFESAIEDLSVAIELGDKKNAWVYYFFRANVRFLKYKAESKMMEDGEFVVPEGMDDVSVRGVALELTQKDLEKVMELAPDFAPVWYNSANVSVAQGRFSEAVAAYTKSIELSPSFGEAFYNRGLTYIYMKDKEKGISDLSRAGELGLYSSYNVIKRFGGRKD